jgi:DNA-binding NtrC family response regulator
MQAYLQTMAQDLREAGLRGHIFIATSFGGAWRPEEMTERPIYSIGSGPSMAPVAALTYAKAETAERDLIVRTLERTRWNRAQAARILGINYKTLYNKLKEYALLRDDDEESEAAAQEE